MRFLLVLILLFASFFSIKEVLANNSLPKTINVYVIAVIDPSIADFNSTRVRIRDNNVQAADYLSNASKYRGYQNSNVPPYLKYEIVGENFIGSSVKPGLAKGSGSRPDYIYYLNNENICDLVDNRGVKQIWFWTQHDSTIEPTESNLSMGTISRKYWNYSTYGDVSNSERTNDLPICNNTYTVYNYNYQRGVGEMLENHTHHLESLFIFLDRSLFWENFVGSKIGKDSILNPGCGWTHYPPNGTADYDWYNKTQVLSDCEDWNPNRTGAKKLVSCKTWSKTQTCPDDAGLSFKLWWMQNLPGYNNGLYYEGKPLINWWDVIYDFDGVLANESGLTEPDKLIYDANKDGQFNVLDITFLIQHIFQNN